MALLTEIQERHGCARWRVRIERRRYRASRLEERQHSRQSIRHHHSPIPHVHFTYYSALLPQPRHHTRTFTFLEQCYSGDGTYIPPSEVDSEDGCLLRKEKRSLSRTLLQRMLGRSKTSVSLAGKGGMGLAKSRTEPGALSGRKYC